MLMSQSVEVYLKSKENIIFVMAEGIFYNKSWPVENNRDFMPYGLSYSVAGVYPTQTYIVICTSLGLLDIVNFEVGH